MDSKIQAPHPSEMVQAEQPRSESGERMRRVSAAMTAIANALESLPDDATRLRVIRAVAVLLGIELPAPRGDYE